eukprot:5870897-Prorocentrum_lima.AAC.1
MIHARRADVEAVAFRIEHGGVRFLDASADDDLEKERLAAVRVPSNLHRNRLAPLPVLHQLPLELLAVGRIPPHVCDPRDHVLVGVGVVKAVLLPVQANRVSHLRLQLGRDDVLTHVHVRHPRLLQLLRKLRPACRADLVVLPDVQGPNLR